MAVEIVFETHSVSEDNDRGIATGWLPGRLSVQGFDLAAEMGARRRNDGIAAVISSDLGRAVETAEVAFGGSPMRVLLDWRLRECNYGECNGRPAAEVLAEPRNRIATPYPGGESWTEAVRRVGLVLNDLATLWDGQRVMLLGHRTTRWALDHWIDGVPLEELVEADFGWQAGWEYQLS